ncbi:unnamed protein product [Peronospora belbahrii]|uniref:Dolichol kinase n=1 Tax=Peronospora belbahrii TaxID=622444 RepID=A0AAU9L6W1_9STRA|nr:unnamed protein product [Peronospora belbahrii]CAH0513561.1 unnamed protein product [Peronospora belbahrii]
MSLDENVSFFAYAGFVVVVLFFQYLVSAQQSDVVQNTVARREDLHLQRKFQHLGTGVMIYAGFGYCDRLTGISMLLVFALLFCGLRKLRSCSNAVNAAYIKCFSSILRQHEVSRLALPGAYYFLLGSSFSLAIFPLKVARLAILHLSVGDPAAAFFGTLYGRHKLVTLFGKLGGNKSLEGSIGCFCVAAAATFSALIAEQKFFFGMTGEAEVVEIAWTISLAAGVGAAVAELVDIGGWDDNLTLPLLSGVFLQSTVGHLL